MAEEIKWKNTIDKSLYLLADMLDDKGAVGSIIITGVNKSPAQLYGLDGTWECIKKELKYQYITNNTIPFINWTSHVVKTDSNAAGVNTAVLSGDGISLRLGWKNNENVSDGYENQSWTTQIGQLNLNKIGIKDGFGWESYGVSWTDSLSGSQPVMGEITLTSSGLIRIADFVCWPAVTTKSGYISALSYPTGQGWHYVTFHYPHLDPKYMLDDFCQTWYWKRTA